MTAPEFASRLDAKRSGSGWTAKCPGHQDRKPSLSISEGNDGRALLHCHAGCPTDEVLAAAGLTKKDLFPNSTHGPIANGVLDWAACVSAFSDKHVARLSTWRGYREETVRVP